MEVRSLDATHAMTWQVVEDCLIGDMTMPPRLEKTMATSAVAK